MYACLAPTQRNYGGGEGPVRKLFVGTVDGVCILEPASGDEWRLTGRGLQGTHLSSLLYEPKKHVLFAGGHYTSKGLYVSTDDGQTWAEKTIGITADQVYTLMPVEADGQVIVYAGTEPPRLFRTRDQGETWEEIASFRSAPDADKWWFPGADAAHVKHISFDPRNPRKIYICVEQGGLYISEDDGHTWRHIAGVPEDAHRIIRRGSNPDYLFLSSQDGLFYSEDSGESWQQLQPPWMRIGYPDALLIDPTDDHIMFTAGAAKAPPWRPWLSADSCVMRSRDGGRSWEILDQGIPSSMRANIEAMGMYVRPDGYTLFAGTSHGDVYSSGDRGDSWVHIASGLPPVSKHRHHVHTQAPAATA
jgi:photosystem II stability/assembly factor-like uncharacterized protein